MLHAVSAALTASMGRSISESAAKSSPTEEPLVFPSLALMMNNTMLASAILNVKVVTTVLAQFAGKTAQLVSTLVEHSAQLLLMSVLRMLRKSLRASSISHSTLLRL